ncbi:hypothetical protein HDU83_000202 [Entophlyctis luteolus]|nr:hypothetical protein HDU83_000202 [Entophlyctis luteolus]
MDAPTSPPAGSSAGRRYFNHPNRQSESSNVRGAILFGFEAGAGAGAYPTPHYARASRSLDDILPPAPGSTIAAPAPTPSLGPLPTPGLPQSPRNLRILPVQSKLSNSDLIFKNDAIFKIKSTEAYLAPPDQLTHLSFRKGQAF